VDSYFLHFPDSVSLWDSSLLFIHLLPPILIF
jgi:hypothetical protein